MSNKIRGRQFFTGDVSFGGEAYGMGMLPEGRPWYVNAKLGSDGNSGGSWGNPFKTMAKAFSVVRSGDRIGVVGKVREQLESPAGVFDVSIIGIGNRPRHGDDHTEVAGYNGGSHAPSWLAPASGAVAATPLLRVKHQGWRILNMLIAGPADYAALDFVRDAGAGNAENDGSHGEVVGCRFAGGLGGIRFGKAGAYTENVFDIGIYDNEFDDQTGQAIAGIAGWRMNIARNRFMAVGSAIVFPATQCVIQDNIIGKFTTKGIDLTGGADNAVTGNTLSGTYSNVGGYTAGTSDEWGGNFNVLSGGVTAALPG